MLGRACFGTLNIVGDAFLSAIVVTSEFGVIVEIIIILHAWLGFPCKGQSLDEMFNCREGRSSL